MKNETIIAQHEINTHMFWFINFIYLGHREIKIAYGLEYILACPGFDSVTDFFLFVIIYET
jgi:hypothetical protein